MKTLLVMEDGSVFEGRRIGAGGDAVCEIVWNTSMAGYLEVITDPSCAGQGVVMTYPMIGGYGINQADAESDRPQIKALIVRELCQEGSNFRLQQELNDYLIEHGVVGIEAVDTRALTRLLRSKGMLRGMITDREDVEACIKELRDFVPENLIASVSTKEVISHEIYIPKIAVLDLGVKRSLIETFKNKGCEIVRFPYHSLADEILQVRPSGIVLAGGPGSPKDYTELLKTVETLQKSGVPLFAISLGHQLLAMANGMKVERMERGHHGANQSVKNLKTGKLLVTEQNHSYAVVRESICGGAIESYRNVNDGTVEGLCYPNRPILSIQFHPDSYLCATGTAFLIDRFIEMMEVNYHAVK